MGDLGFGEPFSMLEEGEEHWAIALLNAGIDPLGFWFPIWFFRSLTSVPGAAKGYHQFIGYCNEQIHKRINLGKETNPDVAGYLVDAYEKAENKKAENKKAENKKAENKKAENKKEAIAQIEADSRLMIVAGSDTTGATLTHICYHLVIRPDIVETIRKEVEPIMDIEGGVNYVQVQDAHYLNSVIHEALRLHPPIPCGVFRQTPREGVSIGEVFIEGKTTI